MNPLRWLFQSMRWLFLLIILFILWQAWIFSRPRPRSLSLAESEAVRRVFEDATAEMASQLQGPVHFGVAHLMNDPGDSLTLALKAALIKRPGWTVEETSVVRRFLADLGESLINATSLDEISHAGRRVQLDVVMAGRVLDVAPRGVGAHASMALYAYDTRSGKWLFRRDFESDWTPSAAVRLKLAILGMPTVYRLGLWILFVLLLPWVTSFATHRVLEKKSNRASLFLLGLYLAADLLVALALMGFYLTGGRAALLLICAALFSLFYTYLACERIAR